jgi:hypothetical protein
MSRQSQALFRHLESIGLAGGHVSVYMLWWITLCCAVAEGIQEESCVWACLIASFVLRKIPWINRTPPNSVTVSGSLFST